MLRPNFVLSCAIALVFCFACVVEGSCPVGDIHLDSDCEVNWLDLRDFAEQWLNGSCSAPGCRSDLHGGAGVNGGDFSVLAAHWGEKGEITLVINELMADNKNTIEDPDERGENPDWIEIYNYGEGPIDIGGMYITDRPGQPTSYWRIPSGHAEQTTVEGGGYLLLWADDDTEQGPRHLNFKIAADGSESVGLYDWDGNFLDLADFDAQGEDESWGRLPDGSSNWVRFEVGSTTPGQANRGRPIEIVINEMMYHPYHPENTAENTALEYIELYNKGADPVSLEGWRFSDGIDYVIGAGVILGVGDYLVVASDVNEFSARYPGVVNVVGGWSGRLSNSGEDVELMDAGGVLMDKVDYCDEGEWAVRRLGSVDNGHRGWEWSDAHDGGGMSLELINPGLGNEYGQNWSARKGERGTAGTRNSVYDDDIAPLIADAEHFPIIPDDSDTVTVTAKIVDELASGVSASIRYRIDRSTYSDGDEGIYPEHDPGSYNSVSMFDDGEHGDGSAGDGVYGGEIPAQGDGEVVEFYVEASDAGGKTRTWPAPSSVDGTFKQVTNALYQVDNSFNRETWTAGTQPIYYLIFTQNEKYRLLDIGDRDGDGYPEYNSDAQMNMTFVSVTGVDIKVRYRCGVRNRGHGSRNDPPNNYRVNFPHDSKWEGVESINLNTKNTYIQLLGNSIGSLSGLPQPRATAVQVRLNGENMAVMNSEMYGSYVHMEVVDSDFISENFPDDDDGNAYKCMRDAGPADWSYEGTDPDNYRYSYLKRTNSSQDDFTDVMRTSWIIDRAPDSNYVQAVKGAVNVENWMRYFAINALMKNNETSLANGYGDDYYTYRGVVDPRFSLIMHDLDSVFGYGNDMGDSIWLATRLDTIERFLEHPEFVGRFFFHLKNFIETTFSAEEFEPFVDELLGDFVPGDTIQEIKDFVSTRNAYVLDRIPQEFSISCNLPIENGYHRTTMNTFSLSGRANSIETRSVLVNGQSAEWMPVEGRWYYGGAAGASESIVDRESDWKYLDDGSDGGSVDDGVNWYAHPDYDDSSWSEGPAELGYGDAGQGRPEATVIDSGPEGDQYITSYFRHTFEANDVSRYAILQLGILVDDGAVVYLNGQEIENARSNLPEGDIDYQTTALVNVGQPEEYTFSYYAVNAGMLNEGINVLAVEIHQLSETNSDVSFDLELSGVLPPEGAGALNPGINRVIVEAFDGPNGSGKEVDSGYVDIWYDTGETNDYPNEGSTGDPEGPVRLIVRDSYLPGIPVLVRVEAFADDETIDHNLWDATAFLSVEDNARVSLSSEEVKLYNGRGSELVTFTGSGDFTLVADIGGVRSSGVLTDLISEPITIVSSPLSGSETWEGVYYITGRDFGIPEGATLTLEPGTLVLVDGRSTPLSEDGIDIDVAGSVNCLGTAERPVTITAANAHAPWGEIHHFGGSSSYQYTNITRAGHSPRSGHSDTGPAIRVEGASITFDHSSITDIVGKTLYSSDGALEFRDCLFARSVMGPEIFGTALLLEDSHIIEMLGIYREDGLTDDDDGIYLHSAGDGQSIDLRRSVFAVGDDDGIDTLSADVDIEDVIVRDFADKGISINGGEVSIARSIVAENNTNPEDPTVVSIGAKAHSGETTTVNMDRVTVVASEVGSSAEDIGIQSHNKTGETSGSIVWNITNCIIDATNPVDVEAPYLESDVHISYSALFEESWPGVGNITDDPLFVSAAGNDYHLRSGSPCIDSGQPSSASDPDGTRADMGALPFDQGKSVKSHKLEKAGDIGEDEVWTASEGPYRITEELTIPSGVTLTIEPGVSVFFEPDTRMVVRGTLDAEGSEYESIRFTRTPGTSGAWGGVQFVGTGTANRIGWAVLEYGETDGGMIGVEDSNLVVENSTLEDTQRRRIRSLDSSLVVRGCEFTDIFGPNEAPSTANMSEHIWGRAGNTGRFIIENNVFGVAKGDNDCVDVDGPSRPSPIPQISNNTFLGSGGDAIEVNGDAHIEGNRFYNIIRDEWNTSGGADVISVGAGTNHVAVRNLFYNTQCLAWIQEDGFLSFANNSAVNTLDTVISSGGGGSSGGPGLGFDVDGSIFWGTPNSFVVGNLATSPTVDNSVLPSIWHSYGTGNIDADPLFIDDEEDFRLKKDSGAIGTGSWGLDMGAFVPSGAAISGEPYSLTHRTTASLTVGGPGITHYKYSLNSPSGPWSSERAVSEAISLTGLVNGQSYTVYAVGRNSAGVWQSEESPTVSHTWTVDTSHRALLINEVLAHTHGNDPDVIELYYDGPTSINVTGMSMTDDPSDPAKFVFSSSSVSDTIMSPGEYMLLFGSLNTTINHLGFALSADGEALYLYDKPNPDGSRDLLDSVAFGPQINDYSIGRVGYDREWKLNLPTFFNPPICDGKNIVQALGDPYTLKINEWLADGQVLFDDDFVELYNPHPLPVSLGGLYMTDRPVTQPDKDRIPDLSFIAPSGYSVFRVNDGNDPDELDFKLSADGEMIGLFDAGLNMIDQVLYGPQTTDISQGRLPDGSSSFEFFDLPTPGVQNVVGNFVVTTSTLVPEHKTKYAIVPTSESHVDDGWRSDPEFDVSEWLSCVGTPGGIGFHSGPDYDPFITLDIETSMLGQNASCYVRIPFTVDGAELADYTGMKLKTRHDDSFVAYLNGVEIDRALFSGEPQWNSASGANHESSGTSFDRETDVSAFIGELRSGNNVLAIQGINGFAVSSDFLISAELDISTTSLDGDYPYGEDLDVLAGLRITEIMYNAPQGGDYDYIELHNAGGTAIQLGGVRFVDGVEFEFPVRILNPGHYVVVVSNIAAFRTVYGWSADIAGQYSGGLSGGGEDIVLTLAWPLEAAVMRFEYSDAWYPSSDGGGDSLHINDATAHPSVWDDAESWHAASPSPGLP